MAQLELKIGDKTYNKAWIDNLSSTSQISTDPASINYGVIPSTGNATMRDINGQIRADIENGVLPVSNAPTKISINGNQIQEHITSDSDYDIINRELNLQFSDRLSLLDKATYEGMPLRYYSMTAYEMLDDVIGSYGGYMRSYPCNWSVFYVSTDDSGEGKVILGKTDITAYIPNLDRHNEWVGTKISVEPNKKHTISCSIRTPSFSLLSGKTGLQIVVSTRNPCDGYDPRADEIASTFLQSDSTNIVDLEFTTTQNSVYFVIMFDNAEKSQTITLDVNTDSVLFDGYSLRIATQNPCDKVPAIVLKELSSMSLSIESYLKEISLQYPFLESSSYRETIEKFCTLAQITFALNKDGKIEFYGARPILYKQNVIAIPNNYKISNLNKTLFLKNKFDGVDIKATKVVDEIDFNKLYLTTEITPTDYLTNSNNQSVFNERRTNTTGYLEEFAKVYINSYYYSVPRITIPKNKNRNKETVLKLFDGVASNGQPNIPYSVTYIKKSGTASVSSTSVESSSIADITLVETASEQATGEIPTSYEYALTAMPPVSASVSFDNLSNNIRVNAFTEDANNYYIDLLLLVGGKYVGVKGSTTVGTGTSSDGFKGESGVYEEYIPLSTSISFYGNVRTINFEDVDASTSNISTAKNLVSLRHNELMQTGATWDDTPLVDKIKGNVLTDYKNGVSTATIDLFCGLGDWGNGEIIQPNDVLRIEGEDGYWRVTGRTFKYNSSPTISLELQEQKTKGWHYLTGNISSGTISTGNFTTNGTKKGTIRLPKEDYSTHTTGFTVTVNFNINGDTTTVRGTGFNSVSVSEYNALGIHSCYCNIDANWSTGTITYTADEKYNKRLGTERKSYVESITIDRIEQFYSTY